jgi:hypothetical protein
MSRFHREAHPRGMIERAVVVSYRHGRGAGAAPEPKHQSQHLAFEVRIDGAEPVTVVDWLHGDVAWLLCEGMEIPVWVDPQTGDVLGIQHEGVAAQLAPSKPDYDRALAEASRGRGMLRVLRHVLKV